METQNVERYLWLMTEIKHRTAVVDAIACGQAQLVYSAPTIEAAYLQFRKMLELVAMGSLVANRAACAAVYQGFENWWRAKQILEKVEKLNPDFYPKPTLQLPAANAAVKRDLRDRPDGYLTRDEFAVLYDKSSDLLHAPNPFAKASTDYGAAQQEIGMWRDKVVGLLNAHRIKLLDDPNLYLVQMGGPGEAPSYTAFAPVPKGFTPDANVSDGGSNTSQSSESGAAPNP